MAIPKLILVGGVAVVGFVVGSGSYFTVDQTELAFTRRLGTVIQPHDAPLTPGFHFKTPLVDSVDALTVTLQTLHIPPFDVLTVDNQKVSIEINFNYTIPRASVYHVLYEVGASGAGGVKEQVIPVVKDRTARIMAGQNMVTVNQNREIIQARIEADVRRTVEGLFGIEAHSLQIAMIKPSDAFMASIDAATQAKNNAIRAENDLRTREFEAQQAAAVAKGRADAAIETARGESEAVLINARAGKQRLELEGAGEGARLAAIMSPFDGADGYLKYMAAQAKLKFPTYVPQIVTGNAAGLNMIVPLPKLSGEN